MISREIFEKKVLIMIKLTEKQKKEAKEFRDDKRKEEPKNIITESIDKSFHSDKAEDILKHPDLFNRIVKEIGKKVVGEESAVETILLVMFGGNLTINAEPTSYNLMVNAKSGTGKDYVVKSISSLFPNERVIIRQRISPTVLTYLKSPNADSWDGYILYLEDISNEVLNHSVFITMSSNRDAIATITIKNQPIDIIIKGKPSIIITTASPNPRQDLLRRYPIINLDESQEQSVAIMNHQALMSMEGITAEYDSIVKLALTLLRRVKVKIPYALEKLTDLMNAHHVIIRTNYHRLLDYIKFSASIHQCQRNKDDEGFILAEPQDYELGAKVFKSTMTNIFSIPLTTNHQRILETISKLTKKKMKKDGKSKITDYNKETEEYPKFSLAELEPHINFISDKQLRRELKKLTDLELLEMEYKEREGFQKNIMVWSYKEIDKFELPKASFLFPNLSET